MTVAFTFPGQGSQFVGMGSELAKRYPQAQAVFDEVDDALNQKLSALVFSGDVQELTLTANAQPALMAVSMATIRALEANGVNLANSVAYVAGHSLGEYSALCAAGMFTLSDTARLLRIRGTAMQEAVAVGEGAMAAIMGMDQASLETVCQEAASGEVCQIANDNGGAQIVISGSRSAIERAVEMASQRGARRAVMLSVSAPFHSALMEPAAEAMRQALAEVKMTAPTIPVISNVAVEATLDPECISARLVEQVTGRVRWRETVEWFAAHGVSTLYEIGAGKTLTGLARRIDRQLETRNVGTPEDIDPAVAALGTNVSE